MPKFLLTASYTTEGVKGVASEGGTSRRTAVEQAIGDLGGSVEAFYFAFGDDDVYVIADFPDSVTAATFSLAVNSTGALRGKVQALLLTAEELDQAAQNVAQYRPPGG
ncbi:MAG TPA: GYD domain-containing protein [Acidimicrobiales bacterium]|nr:GYD domain-containing protein [Acidimicrobiales bacterium]